MLRETYIIGVCGGSGSGKTFFANSLHKDLGTDSSYILYQDHYYKDQSDKFDKDGGSVNFDHPNSLDFDLLAEHLKALKKGNEIQVPQYDFSTHKRLDSVEKLIPKKVIILDGILILSQPKIRDLLDDSIFVETPEEIRFQRRLLRDTAERGRTAEGVKAQFTKQVLPMHNEFVEPSKYHATYISSGTDMETFYRLLYHIKKKIKYLNPEMPRPFSGAAINNTTIEPLHI
jgi:uridine kinase